MDILGFKDLVMRSNHKEIYGLLSEISELREQIDNVEDDIKNPRFGDAEMYTVSFSDSIILFSKSGTLEDFDLFLYTTGWLFASAIEKGVPLKCGLGFGEISLNKSQQIYFGQPIIDAYLLEEEVNYFGIVAHNTIEKYYNDNLSKIKDFSHVFKEIETPLKCGNISHLNLDWFRLLKEDNGSNKAELKDYINKFKNNISGSPRRYIDNTIKVIEKLH